MAKVILKVGAYRFLMPTKGAAIAVVNALIDANELQYEGHDENYNISYLLKPAPACEIESAGPIKIVERSRRKPEPAAVNPSVAPKVEPKPRPRSAQDLWNERASNGNIVPHSSAQKVNQPRETPVQAIDPKPVNRRTARAQLTLIANSIALPAPGVICLEDRKPMPAQSQLFLDEDMPRRARG
jgi:hypothetical protein